jgi:ribosomal protein L9
VTWAHVGGAVQTWADCLAHGVRLRVVCSVTKQEVCDAIYQQTGRNLADMEMEMPEIKTLGTFECSVQLVRPQQQQQPVKR